jgi:hypothetical protein
LDQFGDSCKIHRGGNSGKTRRGKITNLTKKLTVPFSISKRYHRGRPVARRKYMIKPIIILRINVKVTLTIRTVVRERVVAEGGRCPVRIQ